MLIDTSQLRWALGVDCALGLWSDLLDETFNVRISAGSIATVARWLVFRAFAVSIGSARLVVADRSANAI